MSESGGRRIKRSLLIDQGTIRFLSDAETAEFERFYLLRDYLAGKRAELSAEIEKLDEPAAQSSAVNRRRLTNVGTFRAYVFEYLRNHPAINPDATLLVRQLPPGPQGLALEIYCFTRTTEWNAYEDIQSDIFDHIIAITPEFGLRLFQEPAGADISSAISLAATHTRGKDDG
jgi:miniconductance mechanosensitive channel